MRTMLGWIAVPTSLDVELIIKPFNQGTNAGKRLSFVWNGKGCQGNAVAANRTREIRPSGMRGWLAETWAMERAVKVEKRKRRKAMLLPKVARVVFLPADRCSYTKLRWVGSWCLTRYFYI